MSTNSSRRSWSRRALREDRGVNTLLPGSTVPDPVDRLEFVTGANDRPGAMLVVSTRLAPVDVVDALRDRGRVPGALEIVSTRGEAFSDPLSGDENVQVTALDSPDDLTGIGIAVTEALRKWDERGLDGVVYVDSLNALLGYAPAERVLQFVHHLAYLLRRNGAVGYYWFDRSGFDRKTVAMVEELFDVVEDAE